MKESAKNIARNIAGGAAALVVFGYPLISWADVLAHQATGNPHAWNLFVLITKIPIF